MGTVQYVPDKDAIVWSIKQFPGQKEFLMRAHFGLPSITTGTDAPCSVIVPYDCTYSRCDVADDGSPKAPISVKFEIPYFTVSGIQVRYLKIIEKSGYQVLLEVPGCLRLLCLTRCVWQALPWVRYITQNGDYQIRMN